MKTKLKISDQASRLKKIRLYLGLTRQQFGKAMKISQFTIRSWENGAKNFTDEGVERVINALSQKLKFTCSFDWLMYGTGSSPISLYEESKFRDGDVVSIDSAQDKLLKEVLLFKKLNPEVDVIIATDNRFFPMADINDYIGLLPIKAIDAVNKLVLITSNDEESEFGLLKAKKNNKSHFYIDRLSGGNSEFLRINSTQKIYQVVWLRKNY